jgi:hypothetical protein
VLDAEVVPRRRSAATIGLGVVVGVVIVAAAAAGTWFVVWHHEPKLPTAEQTRIDGASCKQLVDLHFSYAENADSVDTARTGLRRVDQRRSALACEPILLSEGTWNAIRYEDGCLDLDHLKSQYAGRHDEISVQTLGQIAVAQASRC